MIVVAIIGILVAVAIPAYGDYTARAQVAEAFTLIDGFKTPLTELWTSSGNFDISTAGVTGITSGKYVAGVGTNGGNVTVGKPFSVVAKFRPTTSGTSSKIAGLSVHMFYNANTGAWTCANGDGSSDDATTISGVNTTTPASSVVALAGPGTSTIPASILPKSCS